MKTLLRFIAEEDAQDLVEYALLCAFIAAVGVLAWNTILSELGTDYTGLNSNTEDLWVPPDP